MRQKKSEEPCALPLPSLALLMEACWPHSPSPPMGFGQKLFASIVGALAGVYIFDPFIRAYCLELAKGRQKILEEKVAKKALTDEQIARESVEIERLNAAGKADSLWAHWWENYQGRGRQVAGQAPSPSQPAPSTAPSAAGAKKEER